MKARWIVPAMLILSAGTTACSHKADPISDAERSAISKEVMKTALAMKDATERMDPDLFTKYCLDSPDFQFVLPYGDAFNYDQSQKLWTGLVNTFVSQTDTLVKTKIIVLSRDTAIFYWLGNVRATGKDGNVFAVGPYSGTDVFRKVGKDWKVVYIHESGPPGKMLKDPATTIGQD